MVVNILNDNSVHPFSICLIIFQEVFRFYMMESIFWKFHHADFVDMLRLNLIRLLLANYVFVYAWLTYVLLVQNLKKIKERNNKKIVVLILEFVSLVEIVSDIISQNFFDDWIIWTFHLWSNYFRMFNYVYNQRFYDPYYYEFDSFNQRGYEKTL